MRSGTTSMTSKVSNASVNMFPSSAEGSTSTFLPLERTGCLRSAPTEGRAETRDAVDLALARAAASSDAPSPPETASTARTQPATSVAATALRTEPEAAYCFLLDEASRGAPSPRVLSKGA